ncbi:MAG: restriction endonuclease [Planctomycetota bacterium]
MVASTTKAKAELRRGPLVAALRRIGMAIVVAGFAILAWAVHRHALWGAVAVALAAAGLLLAVGHGVRASLTAILDRGRLRGRSLGDLDRMSGPAFEDWVAHNLRRSGFVCENLPRTRDFGIDLVASRSGLRIGVQAKRYDGPVGNAAVQQAIAGAGHHGCGVAAVVTQSRFTAAARAQADSADPRVVLVDRAGLTDLGRILRAVRGATRMRRSG